MDKTTDETFGALVEIKQAQNKQGLILGLIETGIGAETQCNRLALDLMSSGHVYVRRIALDIRLASAANTGLRFGRLLSVADAAFYLRVSERQFKSMRQMDGFPPARSVPGHRGNRFDAHELDEWATRDFDRPPASAVDFPFHTNKK